MIKGIAGCFAVATEIKAEEDKAENAKSIYGTLEEMVERAKTNGKKLILQKTG